MWWGSSARFGSCFIGPCQLIWESVLHFSLCSRWKRFEAFGFMYKFATMFLLKIENECWKKHLFGALKKNLLAVLHSNFKTWFLRTCLVLKSDVFTFYFLFLYSNSKIEYKKKVNFYMWGHLVSYFKYIIQI